LPGLVRLRELNVIAQATIFCTTTIVRNAWARGQQLAIHSKQLAVANGLALDRIGWLPVQRQPA